MDDLEHEAQSLLARQQAEERTAAKKVSGRHAAPAYVRDFAGLCIQHDVPTAEVFVIERTVNEGRTSLHHCRPCGAGWILRVTVGTGKTNEWGDITESCDIAVTRDRLAWSAPREQKGPYKRLFVPAAPVTDGSSISSSGYLGIPPGKHWVASRPYIEIQPNDFVRAGVVWAAAQVLAGHAASPIFSGEHRMRP